MSDREAVIRRRLSRIVEATKSAADSPPSAGWWVGDAAGERQAGDDLKAGRIRWHEARRCALAGLTALDGGDLEEADIYAWMATDHFIVAILTRLRPSDLAVLGKPASRRGRPRGSPNVKGRN
jgi:hypothetical protein